MNVPASKLARESQVQAKIRKIRRFSRAARIVCSTLWGFGVVGCVILSLLIVFRPINVPRSGSDGVYSVATTVFTSLQFKVWAFLFLGSMIGVWLVAVHQLHRLFGNLAVGAIYTAENVRRVRNVGLLWILYAVLGIVMPASLVVAHGITDSTVQLDLDRLFPSFGALFAAIVSAGLVLLVSWLMDVGLYAKEHADALEREAELVI